MNDATHPDEVERLRTALWGDSMEADAAVARHVHGCDACAFEIGYHRSVRDAFRRWSGSEVPSRAMALAHATIRHATGRNAAPTVAWLPAAPAPALAGVRSIATSDLHFLCGAGELAVDVVLHPAGRAGRFRLTGQALRADATAAAGVEVTLFVDRRRAAATSADVFGEFAFDAFDGARFGLRIDAAARPTHIEIVPGAGAP